MGDEMLEKCRRLQLTQKWIGLNSTLGLALRAQKRDSLFSRALTPPAQMEPFSPCLQQAGFGASQEPGLLMGVGMGVPVVGCHRHCCRASPCVACPLAPVCSCSCLRGLGLCSGCALCLLVFVESSSGGQRRHCRLPWPRQSLGGKMGGGQVRGPQGLGLKEAEWPWERALVSIGSLGT